jgi:hypothetical protein
MCNIGYIVKIYNVELSESQFIQKALGVNEWSFYF